jgi:outer membrane protein OmpA-like peptidoglycan-associated protein
MWRHSTQATRIRRRSLAALAALAAFAAAGAASGVVRAEEACDAVVPRFNEALRAGDLAAVVQIADRVADDPRCPAALRINVGRTAALAHLREAQRRAAGGASAADQLRLLAAGERLGRPWQLLAAIGDVTQDVPAADGVPDYAAASAAYQEALNDINDEAMVATVPSADTIRSLVRKAEQTRLLADRLVAAPAQRDGRPGGLALRSVRGIVIQRVAMPIHFVRNSTEMTPLGRESAEQLWQELEIYGMPPVRLIGHTDPDGSDAFNLDLSRRRAEAVAAFLRERGYDAGRIAFEGRGKREPLVIEQRERYSQAQVYQMLRRVELVQ